MHQADSWDNKVVFDVEHNAAFATHVFDAYFRTPDATGKTYDAFPDFFLIKPHVLDSMRLPLHSQEEQSLLACKTQALARNGYIGVTKYFDEEFAYHWIKFSPYPFKLGDDACENQAEFYALFSRFILYTREHTSIYGDLTTPSDADHDVGSLLRDIGDRAAQLNEKLKRYPELMLISFDPLWPASEVRKLLSTFTRNDEGGHNLFMEYLRHAMRNKAGVGRQWRVPKTSTSIHSAADMPLLGGRETSIKQSDSSVLADRIEMAKVRSLHLAKLSDETHSKALQAEEEKVRLEALAVVAARKQISDAQAASRAALERLEQIRLARIAEEERIIALERKQMAEEHLASLELVKRSELAEGAQPRTIPGSQVKHEKSHGGLAAQARGVAEPLITLDFKSIAIPQAKSDLAVIKAPAYDPFAYEEKLLVQNHDVVFSGQLDSESRHLADVGVGAIKTRSRKRGVNSVQILSAILFLSFGWVGGRFLFPQHQAATSPVKVQPISFVVEPTEAHPPVSGVIATESNKYKDEYTAPAGAIPLKMSEHLTLK
ncbi:MAG: hypothetical protein PHI29_04310 [Gallionella sp.]|nr:hypothetical protein [Gallionella sp.]